MLETQERACLRRRAARLEPLSHQLGYSMARRSRTTACALFGLTLASLAALAGCGSAKPIASPSASLLAGQSATASALASQQASTSPGTSASASLQATASPTVNPGAGLPHADASLEDLLPSNIIGVEMVKFSMKLSAYMASESDTAGDKALYAPWLVGLGTTQDDVNIALAIPLARLLGSADDPSVPQLIIHAIKVDGVNDVTLSSTFVTEASDAGWPVGPRTVAGKSVVMLINPAAADAGGLATGYVYAKDHVLYTVITDDVALLVQTMILLP
jgi:hypothetical protein